MISVTRHPSWNVFFKPVAAFDGLANQWYHIGSRKFFQKSSIHAIKSLVNKLKFDAFTRILSKNKKLVNLFTASNFSLSIKLFLACKKIRKVPKFDKNNLISVHKQFFLSRRQFGGGFGSS
jgi:hypothetical protein